MKIKKIQGDFTVCKVTDYSLVNFESEYCFIGKTDEEKSLVCLTSEVPDNVSTFNTDYILVKAEREMDALGRLARAGYKVSTGDPYGDYFLNRSVSDIMAEYSEQQDEWESIDLKSDGGD